MYKFVKIIFKKKLWWKLVTAKDVTFIILFYNWLIIVVRQMVFDIVVDYEHFIMFQCVLRWEVVQHLSA
jgi:hypothetical protein